MWTYQTTDKILRNLKIKSIRLFNSFYSVLKIDELNQLGNSRLLYSELDKLARKAFKEIAHFYYGDAYEALEAMGYKPPPKRRLDESWIDFYLSDYDPVTEYVYTHEVERKWARMLEALIASRFSDKAKKRATNLWLQQVSQYADKMTDKAVLQAFRDFGIPLVEWVTEKDLRVCVICEERHGKRYQVDKVPTKPHYRCRCRLRPVKEGK